MTPFLQLALLLAIILIVAKLGGYLSTRLGQPSVLGQLLAGLALGPSLLDIMHLSILNDPLVGETIHFLAEMGVLLLMFIAGLELHLSELVRDVKVSALAGTLGVLVPVVLGWGAGLLFGFETRPALFLGLVLGATSVSISAQTLMELKVLRSRVGLGLLGAAVFDDVLVILFLSTFLALGAGDAAVSDILLIFLRMVVFLAGSVALGLWVIPYLVRRVAFLPISQGVLTLALVVMLLYGLAAEVVGGMAAITGTFLAGLMFARSPEKDRLESGVLALAYGFFVPIFFVNIGLSVNARALGSGVLLLLFVVTVVAVLGKWFGAGLGARLAGFTWRESAQLGAGMVSRGEVGLVVAGIGLNQGLLIGDEFAAVVGVVLITTLITPPTLRLLFAAPEPAVGPSMGGEPEARP